MTHKFVIAIDLGGTNLRVALIGPNDVIKRTTLLETSKLKRKEKLIAAIVDSISGLVSGNGLKKKDFLGVGIGVAGPVNVVKGSIGFLPNIPGWKNVKLKSILEAKTGMPVFLDNDANLMTLAEARKGAARGVKNAVCLTLGTGVGGGIILEGALYRGSTFSAGEIGHIPVNEQGKDCNCGGKGCLETYIGNNRILERAKEVFGRDIRLEEVSALAAKSDARAKGIWKEVAVHLGVALSGVVNLLNPDCIVIGGGVANAGEVLFRQVKETICERAMPDQARHVKVLKAALGSDAGIIGAAILVRDSQCKVKGAQRLV